MVLRTGVVGAGIVSQNNHLPALSRNPRTALAAVADRDPEALREATDEYGVAGYDDAEAMLNEAALDWVHVATPVGSHVPIARMAVERGVPALVQKPAARDADELAELRAFADERGVPVSVVHNHLFYPVVREARERVASGEIGDVRAVEVTVAGEGDPDETYRGDWVLDMPGGDLGEGLPHPLYLLLAFAGPPADESAVDVRTRTVREREHADYDGTAVQYATDDGVLGSVTVLAESSRGTTVRIHGADGSLTVDLPAATVRAHGATDGPYHFFEERLARNRREIAGAVAGLARNLEREARSRLEDRLDLHLDESPDGHYYLIDEAGRAIARGEQPPVDLERSRWVLTLMDAVREAARADGTADAAGDDDGVPAAADPAAPPEPED